MVIIRVLTHANGHRKGRARGFIMADRVHSPPPAGRRGAGSGAAARGAGGAAGGPAEAAGDPACAGVADVGAGGGGACGHDGPLAIAQAAAGWDQETLAAHGCRVSPRTGLRQAPSASTLDRLPRLLDPDELEAGLPGCLAAVALDPRVTAVAAARRREESQAREEKRGKRKRKPPAAEKLREVRDGGWLRAAPGHPWLDPAVTGDGGHVPARPAVAVDGRNARAPRPPGT